VNCGEFPQASKGWRLGQIRYRTVCDGCHQRGLRARGAPGGRAGSRDFPCEQHDTFRCGSCPWEPAWSVPEGRLSALWLYRPGWDPSQVDDGGMAFGPQRAGFRKADAIALFGERAVRRAWTRGLSYFEADEWSVRLLELPLTDLVPGDVLDGVR
jgi:hypothetical protein